MFGAGATSGISRMTNDPEEAARIMARWPRPSLCLGAFKVGLFETTILRDWSTDTTGRHHLVCGPSGIGKSYNFVVPDLRALWMRSAIVHDPDGGLWDDTAGWRRQFGHVIKFCPTEYDTARYNPLFAIRRGDWVYTIRDAQNFAELAISDRGKGDPVWPEGAKDYAAALVVFLLCFSPDRDKTPAGVLRAVLRGKDIGLAMMANQHSNQEVQEFIANGARGLWHDPNEKFVSGVLQSLRTNFRIYADPITAFATSDSDWLPSDLMCREKPVTLYLINPDHSRLAPVMRVIIGQHLAV